MREQSRAVGSTYHESLPARRRASRGSAAGDLVRTTSVGMGWMVVMALGLTPIAEIAAGRPPSIVWPPMLAALVAIASSRLLVNQAADWRLLVAGAQLAVFVTIFAASMSLTIGAAS